MEDKEIVKKKSLFKFSNSIIFVLVAFSLAVFAFVAYTIYNDNRTSVDEAVADVEPASLYVLRRDPVVTSLGNNEYQIEITFFVRNNNTREVIDITGTSSIQFAGNYSLTNKVSDNLTLNPSYDAKANNSLFSSGQSLSPGESTNITYTFRASSDTINGLSQFLMSMSIAGSSAVPPPSTGGGNNNNGGGNTNNPGDPVITPDPVDLESDLTPRTFQYRLMNADTGEVIKFISEGEEIDVSKLPTRNFTIEAIPNIAIEGSVKFGLNGNDSYRNENSPGFFLTGNNGDLFSKWNYALGAQTLTATGYAAKNGLGTSLGGTTINFTLIDTNPDSAGNNSGSGTNSGSADVSVDLDFNNQSNGNGEQVTDEAVEEPVTTDDTAVVSNSGSAGTPETLPNTGIEMPNILYVGIGLVFAVLTLELSTILTKKKFSE